MPRISPYRAGRPSAETDSDQPLLLLIGPLTQPMAKTYIDFVLGAEGQKLVEEDGWVPVR
jgi:hypothetical protein